MGAAGVPSARSVAVALVMAVYAPASSMIARWIDGNRYSLAFGPGAAPAAFLAMDAGSAMLGFELPLTGAFTAIAITYVMAEGTG